jgi:hypothetical protein
MQFFRQHRHPGQAFNDARSRFDLTRAGLLRMLASSGVTEMEAYAGRLPDAMTLWQRIRSASHLAAAGSTAPPASATQAPRVTPSPGLEDFAAALQGQLQSASPSPASTPSTGSHGFAASLEDLLQSATPASAATPSVLGKRPAPSAASSPAGSSPASPEPLHWGAQGARSQRQRLAAEHQPVQAPVAALPGAQASPAIAPQAEDDDMDFGLLDPGTPTAGDLAFLDAMPSWFDSATGQRPPSSSTAPPPGDPAGPSLTAFANWIDGLPSAPPSPSGRDENSP